MKSIAFIGNFIPSHSTENERVWSFRKLGQTVIEFQENKTTAQQLREAMPSLDMLCYSHTHDQAYIIDGLKEVFAEYKAAGVPTVSVHLDRWAWLERQKDMGQEATWDCEYIFMADGSPEAVELYEKLGLNWHWLKPGVVEKDCYIAEPDHDKFPYEIIFTGSKGYHKEYPFRPQLIDWLYETYGDRFGHYGNDGIRVVRQDELNVLCSTAKIVVGDSCFAGQTSNYWSDRVTESMGRGSFLLHPAVEGLDIPGMGEFKAGDLGDLQQKIEYYLTHEEEREKMRIIGHEHVKKYETYTERAKEIIEVVFG